MTAFFHTDLDAFISLSCIIALASTPSSVLNRSVKSGQCYTWAQRKRNPFNFSPLINVTRGFIVAFVMLRCAPSIHKLLRAFIMKMCCILSDVFFCDYWNDFVIFLSYYWCVNCIYGFAYVEPSLNPTCPYLTLWMHFYIRLANICCEFLYLYLLGILVIVYFSCDMFISFWYQNNGGFIEWFRKCSFFPEILEEFGKDGY